MHLDLRWLKIEGGEAVQDEKLSQTGGGAAKSKSCWRNLYPTWKPESDREVRSLKIEVSKRRCREKSIQDRDSWNLNPSNCFIISAQLLFGGLHDFGQAKVEMIIEESNLLSSLPMMMMMRD